MFGTFLAWENRWHFTMPAAVPLYPDLKSASDWMKQISNQSEALCGSGLCMSTVWNFYARFSDVISWRNHRWHSEKLAVFPGYNSFQGPKLRLPGRQCDQKFSSGDQNFIAGRQLATCKAGCYCRLSCSEKMIENWNLEALCQQVSYFLSCWYFFNLKVKRIFL